MPDGADLEHHHADGVGDDVVELAGDPRALLGHRDARRRLALPLGLGRALFRRLGLLGPLAQGEAGEPGDREQERDEDELARRVAGVVVDDDRRAAEHDRQAEPRLHGVAEVAEQERRGHAGDEGAAGEHDQPPVDERERRGRAARPPRARAKGKRRRASSGSTTTAIAGTANHSVVLRRVRRVAA